MNFLAHLHIAHRCQSSLAGNLLGDFVKGNPDNHFVPSIASGIRLHRFIDSYIDAHDDSKVAKSLFPDHQRRFAPIALDMFWDHCLARHWADYHPTSLRVFCKETQRDIQSQPIQFPPRFLQVTQSMWQGRWLESYAEMENISFALHRMSLRSERMAPLAACNQPLLEHYDPLLALFKKLYPHLIDTAIKQVNRS
ncbi:ACP phosphodiesterase [Aliivibrio kagoshimensis]|uniref:acyl carrier protein phosphodiesterase n=1 Tax=Aliivibrio kagoshimensis TaxID=2910230 RepID=UPI003D0AD494